MIEGLKVTVKGDKLATIAADRAAMHEERATFYKEQAAAMRGDRDALPGSDKYSNSSSGDPAQAAEARGHVHDNKARELRFISENLQADESYLLEWADLERLGVVANRF